MCDVKRVLSRDRADSAPFPSPMLQLLSQLAVSLLAKFRSLLHGFGSARLSDPLSSLALRLLEMCVLSYFARSLESRVVGKSLVMSPQSVSPKTRWAPLTSCT